MDADDTNRYSQFQGGLKVTEEEETAGKALVGSFEQEHRGEPGFCEFSDRSTFSGAKFRVKLET